MELTIFPNNRMGPCSKKIINIIQAVSVGLRGTRKKIRSLRFEDGTALPCMKVIISNFRLFFHIFLINKYKTNMIKKEDSNLFAVITFKT